MRFDCVDPLDFFVFEEITREEKDGDDPDDWDGDDNDGDDW